MTWGYQKKETPAPLGRATSGAKKILQSNPNIDKSLRGLKAILRVVSRTLESTNYRKRLVNPLWRGEGPVNYAADAA